MKLIDHLRFVGGISFLLLVLLFTGCRDNLQQNELSEASSPYLKRHATNPVDWRMWDENLFESASIQNKLVIVSIGYSSCHWCHVMEEETFQDDSVAHYMNENFLSVKVDREERPDIDKQYMKVAQLLMGQAGWPLNVITLPDGKPIYATTYLSKEDWVQTLSEIQEVFRSNPENLEKYADQIKNEIAEPMLTTASSVKLERLRDEYEVLMSEVVQSLDTVYGGYAEGGPKFPKAPLLGNLLDYCYYSNSKRAKGLLRITLDEMYRNALYDHLGGGFFRYTTDNQWRIPHFEKMLYDNAQLLSVYSKAFRMFGDSTYLTPVYGIRDFLENTLKAEDGLYYGSTDAQSDGEEGAYYLWSSSEWKDLIQNKDYLAEYYGLNGSGIIDGKMLPVITVPLDSLRKKVKRSANSIEKEIENFRVGLINRRSERTPPKVDRKLILSWNALAVTGLCEAFAATGDSLFIERAEENLETVFQKFVAKDGTLIRSISENKVGSMAMLDDYSNLMLALIKIYELTFDETYLDKLIQLRQMIDDKTGNLDGALPSYNFGKDDQLVTAEYDLFCTEIPSSTASFTLASYYIDKILGNSKADNKAISTLQSVFGQVRDQPVFYATWLKLQGHLAHPFFEVAIVGQEALEMRKEFCSSFAPNTVFVGANQPSELSVLSGKYQETRTLIYVCTNGYCKLPVEEPAIAKEQLLTSISRP